MNNECISHEGTITYMAVERDSACYVQTRIKTRGGSRVLNIVGPHARFPKTRAGREAAIEWCGDFNRNEGERLLALMNEGGAR